MQFITKPLQCSSTILILVGSILHCCTGSTILRFKVYIMPWQFEIRIAFKNEKDHVINKIIVISKILVFIPDL